MRAHISIDDDLVREVDELAGKRKRSEFIEAAVREKLRHERQRAALRASAGILKGKVPEWSTPEKTYQWIRAIREESDRRVDELWAKND